MVFRRRRRASMRPTWYVDILVPAGVLASHRKTRTLRLSTGTTDRDTARAIERAMRGLVKERAWPLLDAVAAGRLTVGQVYDAHRHERLAALERSLDEVDLAAHVAGWQAWLTDRVATATGARYLAHVRTLIPEGPPYLRSAFTADRIAEWLATRTMLAQKRRSSTHQSRRTPDAVPRPASGPSKRKYRAAVQSFAKYLCEIRVLVSNPVRDVTAPPANKPRCRFLELPDVLRLVEGTAPPFRGIFALAYGAGIEISAILALTESDIDARAKIVRARGTKSHARDRLARVATWAWPFVAQHLATLTPGERVFRASIGGRPATYTGTDARCSGSRTTGSTMPATIGPCAPSGPARPSSWSPDSWGTRTWSWWPRCTADSCRRKPSRTAGKHGRLRSTSNGGAPWSGRGLHRSLYHRKRLRRVKRPNGLQHLRPE